MDDLPCIKFYADTHIAKAVAIQLRNHGVDIVRCEEVGLAEAKDTAHLQYATSEGRVMVSMDRDFPDLHQEWQNNGLSHAGILMIAPKYQGDGGIGTIVHEILFWHEAIMAGAATLEGDVKNQLLYVW